jgi:HSP20 family protein
MNALIPRMTRHSRLAPLRNVHSADRLFDDLWRGFAVAPGRASEAPRADFVPRVDIRETEEEIVLTAELPGVDDKDFEVILEDDVLILKGEKRTETEADEQGVHRVEILSGSFERRFALPFEADADAVKAAYKNGVLTVTVLKPTEAKPQVRQIEVSTA